MTPTKQKVYLPVKVEDELPNKNGDYCVLSKCNTSFPLETSDTLKFQDGKFQEIPNWVHIHWLKEQQAFVFTPEQLNEYTANVVRQALETAAENADSFIDMNEDAYIEGNVWSEVDKESITNTLEETCKKFEV